MKSITEDVWKDIVWCIDTDAASLLSRTCTALYTYLSKFQVYWYHHYKMLKDASYCKKVIHHRSYIRSCIRYTNVDDCVNFIRKHLDDVKAKEEFEIKIRACGDREYAMNFDVRRKEFFTNLIIVCSRYLPLLAKHGWNCGVKSHIVSFQTHPSSWRTLNFNTDTNPIGGWFNKYRRERYQKGKNTVKRIKGNLEKDPKYGCELFAKYVDMKLELERMRRELWYINNIHQLEKDVEECTFATKGKKKGIR